MIPFYKTRDLARSLIASEFDASTTTLQTNAATVRVYEKLRQQLGAPVGVDGFQTLASRALALAKVQFPGLSAVQVAVNGELRGLDGLESQTGTDADPGDEAGVLFIAQLLGLFLTFLGEATTLHLIEDLRRQIDAGKELLANPEADARISTVDEPVMAAAFEALLMETNRLRSVSDRIEALAAGHFDLEQGLASAVGNIRNIAAVLDIFALIRSKAGGPQDEIPSLETNRYMN